jgi:hypothetical protein
LISVSCEAQLKNERISFLFCLFHWYVYLNIASFLTFNVRKRKFGPIRGLQQPLFPQNSAIRKTFLSPKAEFSKEVTPPLVNSVLLNPVNNIS